MNLFVLIPDPKHIVGLLEVGIREVLVAFRCVISENDEFRFRSAVSTCSGFVECSQSQCADVTCSMVAWCDGMVDHG